MKVRNKKKKDRVWSKYVGKRKQKTRMRRHEKGARNNPNPLMLS